MFFFMQEIKGDTFEIGRKKSYDFKVGLEPLIIVRHSAQSIYSSVKTTNFFSIVRNS